MAKSTVSRSMSASKSSEEISDQAHIATPPGESASVTKGERSMNMMSALKRPDDAERPVDWEAALNSYQAARAFSDALPANHPDEDAAVDAYCEAMDHLVETVRAPSSQALAVKLDLARKRWTDIFMPDEWFDAFQADLAALGTAAEPQASSRFVTRAKATNETPTGLVAGDRLPMCVEGVSPSLADLLTEWQEAYYQTFQISEDDDVDAATDNEKLILAKIEAFPSASFADLTVKLSVALFQLNGAGVTDLPGIEDGCLLIRDDFALDLHAENLLSAVCRDAAALAAKGVPTSIANGNVEAPWIAALSDFQAADDEMERHYRDEMTPANERWESVRSQWPKHGYTRGVDPKADAILDEASTWFDPVQDAFDARVSERDDRFGDLFLTPAPSLQALRFKLALGLEKETIGFFDEVWAQRLVDDCDGLIAQLGQAENQRGHIQAMHDAWVAANAAYDANDRYRSKDKAGRESVHAEDAEKLLARSACHLASAILMTPPTNDTDAALLLFHLGNATDMVAASVTDSEDEIFDAMNCATSSLMDWAASSGLGANGLRGSALDLKIVRSRTRHLRGEIAA